MTSEEIIVRFPRLLASRPRAQEALAGVPLDAEHVRLDCQDLQSTAPSAMDEVVRSLAKERGVKGVHVVAATPRASDLIKRFAKHYRAMDCFHFSETRTRESSR